ncbi:hypothetical protein V5799_006961 [Amblyomma americanum]|uniref:Uncharacterized protein n=1 Tax=Amblyomma americanum TaxID=6943 RepID=A0AAQ4DUW9_AMBAM
MGSLDTSAPTSPVANGDVKSPGCRKERMDPVGYDRHESYLWQLDRAALDRTTFLREPHVSHQHLDDRIVYDHLDIDSAVETSAFVTKYGQFARVYSFLCFHLVSDQTASFRNIGRLLSTDGECLVTACVTNPALDAWLDVLRMPEWKNLVPRIQNFWKLYISILVTARCSGWASQIGNLANGEETYLCMVALEFLNNDTLLANKQLREVTHMPGYSSMESGLCRAFFLGPSQVLPPLTVVTASVFRVRPPRIPLALLMTTDDIFSWRQTQLVKFENFEEYFLYDDPNLQWRKSDLAVVVARIRYQNNDLPGLQIYTEAERGNETFYVLLDERVVPVHQKNAVYATRRAHSG